MGLQTEIRPSPAQELRQELLTRFQVKATWVSHALGYHFELGSNTCGVFKTATGSSGPTPNLPLPHPIETSLTTSRPTPSPGRPSLS